MIIITLDFDATFIVNVFGGRNVCDVDFKFDSKKNSKIIVIVVPIYLFINELFYELLTLGIFEVVTLFWIPFLQFTA